MGLRPVLYKQIFDNLFVKFQKSKVENGQELKKRKIDIYQHVSSKYKGAERLRASIYNDIRQAYENQNEEELPRNIEQLRRRVVYGFYTSKEMDKESKSILKISNF